MLIDVFAHCCLLLADCCLLPDADCRQQAPGFWLFVVCCLLFAVWPALLAICYLPLPVSLLAVHLLLLLLLLLLRLVLLVVVLLLLLMLLLLVV